MRKQGVVLVNSAIFEVGKKAVLDGSIDVVSNPALSFIGNESELIERKGKGHPDSICDELAAEISRQYSLYTVRHCDGAILHHQIDKLMLIGGETEVEFGGGSFTEPIQIILAGRITRTYLGKDLPVTNIINKTIRSYFAYNFPMIKFDDSVKIYDFLTSYAGPGTLNTSKGAIANMFSPIRKDKIRGYENLVANDTSFCVAYEPLSILEKTIKDLEKHLTGKVIKKRHPWLGTDIKIMAYRLGNVVEVTACIPQIAQYVESYDHYQDNLDIIGKLMLRFLTKRIPHYSIQLALNTKDDEKTNNFYLTVSGASLSGDIGVVGRGNRTNGLITAHRPMSLEGTNGKNPRYYSGFIYAVASKRIAKRIYKETNRANIVEIVSQNGGNLLNPWHTRVTTDANAKQVHQIVKDELRKIPQLTELFLKGALINH